MERPFLPLCRSVPLPVCRGGGPLWSFSSDLMKPCLNWHGEMLSMIAKIALLMQYKEFHNNNWIQNRMRNLHLHAVCKLGQNNKAIIKTKNNFNIKAKHECPNKAIMCSHVHVLSMTVVIMGRYTALV